MYRKRLNNLYEAANRVDINNRSKIVIFSDCHRGDGGNSDNFAKNENLYYHALRCYYSYGYTYIEAGDTDELWENKRLSDIVDAHTEIYRLLCKFYKRNRLYMLYGNHDMAKLNERNSKCIESYFNKEICDGVDIETDVTFYEALVLRYYSSEKEILITHGHQVDFLNYDLWRLTRLMVRYVWRPLESIGFKDPTNASTSRKHRKKIERHLSNWASDNVPIITGHTHRPRFPEEGDAPYFNSGSCVNYRGITCIEISDGMIMLVMWKHDTRPDGSVYVTREVIGGPEHLNKYFVKKDMSISGLPELI
ncbi:MAG TPA: metallophosphoesterase [Clostridia bacterium]|nr:metallophosphoesterase [Clostridia bacterium]